MDIFHCATHKVIENFKPNISPPLSLKHLRLPALSTTFEKVFNRRHSYCKQSETDVANPFVPIYVLNKVTSSMVAIFNSLPKILI